MFLSLKRNFSAGPTTLHTAAWISHSCPIKRSRQRMTPWIAWAHGTPDQFPKRANIIVVGTDRKAARRSPRVLQSPSAHSPKACHRGRQHFVAGAGPPVVRKDLDLLHPAIAGGLDHRADRAKIDDAVAHHAAVVEHVAGRHQPVADVVGNDAAASAGDLHGKFRVPPHVIGIDCDAEVVVADGIGYVEHLLEGGDAAAIRRVHRMQRLQREAHVAGARMGGDRREPFGEHRARPGKSREPGASPPPITTMASASIAAASSIMRRLSSIAAFSWLRPPRRTIRPGRSPSPVTRGRGKSAQISAIPVSRTMSTQGATPVKP